MSLSNCYSGYMVINNNTYDQLLRAKPFYKQTCLSILAYSLRALTFICLKLNNTAKQRKFEKNTRYVFCLKSIFYLYYLIVNFVFFIMNYFYNFWLSVSHFLYIRTWLTVVLVNIWYVLGCEFCTVLNLRNINVRQRSLRVIQFCYCIRGIYFMQNIMVVGRGEWCRRAILQCTTANFICAPVLHCAEISHE